MSYSYTTRKYMGDDAYSWAVFGPDGRPVMTGMSQREARWEAKRLRTRELARSVDSGKQQFMVVGRVDGTHTDAVTLRADTAGQARLKARAWFAVAGKEFATESVKKVG